MTALDDFLDSCAAEIGRRVPLAAEHVAELAAGHRAFVAALAEARPTERDRSTVPAAASLDDAPPSPLIDLARSAADELSWAPSSRLDDQGREAALAPLNDVRTLDAIIAGLMLVRPGGTYPLHAHPPQELYLPISGDGEWRFGGSDEFRRLGRDELIYNHPHDPHSVIAGDEPVLALYVLWGPGIDALD